MYSRFCCVLSHGRSANSNTKRTLLHLRRGCVYRILKDVSLNQVGKHKSILAVSGPPPTKYPNFIPPTSPSHPVYDKQTLPDLRWDSVPTSSQFGVVVIGKYFIHRPIHRLPTSTIHDGNTRMHSWWYQLFYSNDNIKRI